MECNVFLDRDVERGMLKQTGQFEAARNDHRAVTWHWRERPTPCSRATAPSPKRGDIAAGRSGRTGNARFAGAKGEQDAA
jgi:hypothetical protein